MKISNVSTKDQAQIIDTFLKFCYCFPLDIEDRFKEAFGESMGSHFYSKFKNYCARKDNTFVAMVYTVGDMTNGNKEIFIQMIEDYYSK